MFTPYIHPASGLELAPWTQRNAFGVLGFRGIVPMTEFGWVDFCYGGRQQQSCCGSHLQAVVSELDCVIKDVEGLKEQMVSIRQPELDGPMQAAIETQLSACFRRSEELHLKWQQEVAEFAKDLRLLKTQDLVELRSTLGSHAAHLTSLDSDLQVLRQMMPVHGASLKATEAALQLLRESTERSLDGLRQDIAMDQKRRAHNEERASEQQREAEEAFGLLTADISALKKVCRQTNASLMQLRETMPDILALSQDLECFKRETEQHTAKITSLARSVSIIEEQQGVKGKEVERIRSEVNVLKSALHHISTRGPDLTRSPEFQQLRSDLSTIAKRMEYHQKQANTGDAEEAAALRVEVQHLRADMDSLKEAKLLALKSTEKTDLSLTELAKAVETLQQHMELLSIKQSRMKNFLEQLRSGFSRWSVDSSPQLSSRLVVPVNSSRLATPRSSRKLLVQPNSPGGLAASRNKRGPAPGPQSAPKPGVEDCPSSAPDCPSPVNVAAAAAAAAALSTTKVGTQEYGYMRAVQPADLRPQLASNSKTPQQQPAEHPLAPSARTPSTPPAFARLTLQSPHNNRGLATRRHSSAGAPLQQQKEEEQPDQQQQQMDLLHKRRVNHGHNIAQQTTPPVESRKGDGMTHEPAVSLPAAPIVMPPSALRSARTSPSPNPHAARVYFRDPPESSTRNISIDESQDESTDVGRDDFIEAEKNILGDFTKTFVGRNIRREHSQKKKEQSSAENAIQTFKNFFLGGGSGSPTNAEPLAGNLPQWQQPTKQLQSSRQAVETSVAEVMQTKAADPFALDGNKQEDSGAVDRLAGGINISRIPVTSTCSNSTTDSSPTTKGSVTQYSNNQLLANPPSQANSPFNLDRKEDARKELTETAPGIHACTQPPTKEEVLHLDVRPEDPLTATGDLRN